MALGCALHVPCSVESHRLYEAPCSSVFQETKKRFFVRPALTSARRRSFRCGALRCMAPDEEKMTKRSPLDFPIEWERPAPGRRPDIFPQFSPMKPPLPQPPPADPPFEEEEEEERKDPEIDPDKEGDEEEEEKEQPEEK